MVNFGTDFKVNFESGDISINANNDFVLISDNDNLEQAVRTRIMTKKGSLATHVDFGSRLYELIGQNIDEDAINAAGSFVHQAVSEEPRIQEITSVNIDFRTINDKPVLVVFLELLPIGTDVPLNLVVNYEV